MKCFQKFQKNLMIRLKIVENICLSENILNRLEQLDPNPIWKYYLLIMKINDKEDKEIIIDLCNYIYSNVQKFSYLDV